MYGDLTYFGPAWPIFKCTFPNLISSYSFSKQCDQFTEQKNEWKPLKENK